MPPAVVEIVYPAGSRRIGLRGSTPPLAWERTMAPTRTEGDRHVFELPLKPGELLEFKILRDDDWSQERNHSVVAGETLVVRPHFDRMGGLLEPPKQQRCLELRRFVSYQVFLPPSYLELPTRRYPVLYAQDGQSLFAVGQDPDEDPGFRIDATLDELYELGVVDEMIVVAVRTDEGRIDMLSPTRDRHYGGGKAPRYLRFLVETLKPVIDAAYRTRPGREDTGLLGSSMGGLFSFFAAWSRPDVFGKAACLSSSFWWDDRRMVREVRGGACPAPRPTLYIDSGAARSIFEEDASRRDGFHHTAAMHEALVGHCYLPGSQLHFLAFPGAAHEGSAWAARLALPLQLLYPRSPTT